MQRAKVFRRSLGFCWKRFEGSCFRIWFARDSVSFIGRRSRCIIYAFARFADQRASPENMAVERHLVQRAYDLVAGFRQFDIAIGHGEDLATQNILDLVHRADHVSRGDIENGAGLGDASGRNYLRKHFELLCDRTGHGRRIGQGRSCR
jgi:hypothetical protein